MHEEPPHTEHAHTKHAPPWLYGLTTIPFGVGGAFVAVAMPKMMRDAGIEVSQIAHVAALAMLPAAWQFLWTPIVDLGPRRKFWLIVLATLSGLCFGATFFVPVRSMFTLFTVLTIAGTALSGLTGSCNGALIATTMPDELRGRTSGWMNAANLGGSVLGGGVVLSVLRLWGPHAAGAATFLLLALPSLVALAIAEPVRAQQHRMADRFSNMIRDVWRTVRSRTGWTGILFLLSPVGTAALLNLLSGIAKDYHADDKVTEMVNGYLGGGITAVGALLSGYFVIDRMNRRYSYLLCGVLTALVCLGMMFAPLTQTSYAIGSLAYLLVAGFCYASFSAVVFEIIGQAGASASMQYALFTAAGNQAIAYVIWFDGKGYDYKKSPVGMIAMDGALNLVGVGVLCVMIFFVLPRFLPERRAEVAA